MTRTTLTSSRKMIPLPQNAHVMPFVPGNDVSQSTGADRFPVCDTATRQRALHPIPRSNASVEARARRNSSIRLANVRDWNLATPDIVVLLETGQRRSITASHPQ